MAYQSFFGSGTGTATPKAGGGYQSFFGFNVRQAPSASDLAIMRQQQAQQDAQAKADQKKQQQQAKQDAQNNSLLGKVKNAGRGLIEGAKTTGEKALNTVTAGGAGLLGLTNAGVDAALGNKKGVNTDLAATQATMNEFLDKGVGGKGGYISSKQAASRGTGTKGVVNDVVKPISQGTTDILPYIVPAGKVSKGASLLTKIGRGALDNALVTGGSTVANEAIQGRLKTDNGGELAKNVATAAVVGGAIPLLHGAVKEGAAKDAKVALNNAKTNALVEAGAKANTADTVGKAAVKSANTKQIPVVSPTESNAGKSLLGKVSFKGANTQDIPVTGTSKAITGKVKTIDEITYTKESKKLSAAYDKESAAIKDQPPIKQQVLQNNIDAKYADLQQKLDESAGKTQVSFGGAQRPAKTPIEVPATTTPPPKVNSIPANVLAVSEAKRPQPVTQPIVETAPTPSAPVEKNISSETPVKAVVEPPATVPERGTSKVATSIQEKAVARGLKNDFGTAGGYDKTTIADQAAKAVKVANDRPLLDQIISGEKPLPDGLRATALIKAVEEHPVLSKDVPLLNRLSQAEHLTGESSRSAQELRLAAERAPRSPVEAIRSVRKAREAAVERKTGKTVAKAQNDELKAIRAAKSQQPKPTKETFASFVESLKC